MAALALAGGDQITAIDAGNSSYAQYVIYKNGEPIKAVLINTDYYSGNGTRPSSTFTLTDLVGSTVKAIRMTASSSDVTTEPGDNAPAITIGGRSASSKCLENWC